MNKGISSCFFSLFLGLFSLFVSLPHSVGATPTPSQRMVRLAITIDDLPSSGPESPHLSKTQIAEKIISTLTKFHIPHVYGFVNGIQATNMQERQEILKKWKAAGFPLGNHTYSHFDYLKTPFKEFTQDIEKNESLLIDSADSIQELKVLRFPYLNEGESSAKRYNLRAYLKKRKYLIAPVSIDFNDWAWLEPFNRCSQKNNSFVLKELKKSYLDFAQKEFHFSIALSKKVWGDRDIPHILLLHLNAPTAMWLEDLLKQLQKDGVQFISARKAIEDPFYQEDTTYVGNKGLTYPLQAAATRKISIKDLPPPQSPNKWLSQVCKD